MLIFPASARPGVAERILIELRDVSLADQPSTVVAVAELRGMSVAAGSNFPFELSGPEVAGNRSLNLRAEVELERARYLTTASIPVATSGDQRNLRVALTKIAG